MNPKTRRRIGCVALILLMAVLYVSFAPVARTQNSLETEATYPSTGSLIVITWIFLTISVKWEMIGGYEPNLILNLMSISVLYLAILVADSGPFSAELRAANDFNKAIVALGVTTQGATDMWEVLVVVMNIK